jgi:serine protease Do
VFGDNHCSNDPEGSKQLDRRMRRMLEMCAKIRRLQDSYLMSKTISLGVAILLFTYTALATPVFGISSPSLARVITGVQSKIVKIYGAGGVRGLEAYQSGFLCSAEGHIVTTWSYVLDTDLITVVLDDGRRFEAETLGADPRLEIALLKIEAEGLDYFDLDTAVALSPGTRVLAFSNVFGVATGNEPASVLHGHVSAVTKLTARRGTFETPYQGTAYVLDAMTNNPGATGGALTDYRGNIAALLGKELRNSLDNTWLNYAIPIAELHNALDEIRAGKVRPRVVKETDRKPLEPVTSILLGIVLVPDVLAQTPPFIDHVSPESSASDAGLQPDDMILFVNDRMVRSARDFKEELSYIDRIDEVRMLVQRGQALLDVSLFAPD